MRRRSPSLAEIDVSNPKALRLVRTLTLDGAYVAARLVGGSVRIVATSQVPSALPFVQPKSGTKEELAAAGKRNRAVVASSRVGSWLPSYQHQATGSDAEKARARPVPQRAPAGRLLRPRHADRADGRPHEGARARRLDRRDDRRADRLRVAGEPVRRDRALGRPPDAGAADAGEARRLDLDPQVRHLEPGEDAVPGQRRGVRLPAQPVVALRVPRRPARRQHRVAGVVGSRRRDRVVPDDAAPAGRRARSGRPDRRAGEG